MTEIKDEEVKVKKPSDFPPEIKNNFKKAKELNVLTLVFLGLNSFILYMLSSGSQAMKAAWLEDLLSLTPSIVFLFTNKYLFRPPNPDYPLGYEKLKSLGFLVSSGALLLFGLYLFWESLSGLLTPPRPTIGAVGYFGFVFWKGWIMAAALAAATVSPILLGRAKFKLAKKLNDPTLYTDGKILKADWMSGLAAAMGILGLGLGLWWADSLAALLISLDILYDGFRHIKISAKEVIDKLPMDLEGKVRDPLLARIAQRTKELGFTPALRFHSLGPRISGQVFVEPKPGMDTKALEEEIEKLDWRIVHVDVVVDPRPKEG